MNVVPLFSERKEATKIWNETIHWWHDHSIKIRFVETDEKYWFVLGGESKRPQTKVNLKDLKPTNLFSKFYQNLNIMNDLKKVMEERRILD